MHDGRRESLPNADLETFLGILRGQAEDEGIVLDVVPTDNQDGTTTIGWTVREPPADPAGLMTVTPDLPVQPPVQALDQPAPPPPGAPGPFVGGRKTADKTIVYTDAAGRQVMRQGGSRAWRNNNPGNIKKGVPRQIGDDGRFAVFPDEATGRAAIVALLRSDKYRGLTLHAAIFKYAPPVENNSADYLASVVRQTGVAAETFIKTLDDTKLLAIADVIKRVEGWKPGVERPLGPDPLVAGAPAQRVIPLSRGAQEWMDVAEGEAALPARERSVWPDPAENPRILRYLQAAAPWSERGAGDETDWCAAFVNYCLITAGHLGTGHPGARSFFWNRNGHFVSLGQPAPGAVAVRRYAPFDDPLWTTGHGHVGFVTAFTRSTVTLLGGNQGLTVNRTEYPLEVLKGGSVTARFVAYMMPVMP